MKFSSQSIVAMFARKEGCITRISLPFIQGILDESDDVGTDAFDLCGSHERVKGRLLHSFANFRVHVHGFTHAHSSFVIACIQKLGVPLLRSIGWPSLALGKHDIVLFLCCTRKTSLRLHLPRIQVHPFSSILRSEGLVSSMNGHANGRRNFILVAQLCLFDRPRVGNWH